MTISTYSKIAALVLASAVAAMVLVWPAISRAAFDDVTLTTDTDISSGGVTFDVFGSSAVVESIEVDTSTFTLVMPAGSTIAIQNSNSYRIDHNIASTEYYTTHCPGSSVSRLTITIPAAVSDQTITITPTTSTCGSSGGSSPSGGGSPPPATVTTTTTATTTSTTTPTTQTQTTPQTTTLTGTNAEIIAALTAQVRALMAQLQALIAARGGTSFTRDLQVGSTGDDVRALQVYLNAKGYMLAPTGPGSPGNETTRFGSITKAALIKLQKAAGITPLSGYFGPKTRAFITANP